MKCARYYLRQDQTCELVIVLEMEQITQFLLHFNVHYAQQRLANYANR